MRVFGGCGLFMWWPENVAMEVK